MAKKNQNEALVKALLSLTAPKIDNSKMANQLKGFPQGMGSKQGVYNLPADYNVKNELVDAALFANSFAPVTGDIQSGVMAAQDLAKGNYGMAALNAIGLLPFIPSMGGVIKNSDTFEQLAKTGKIRQAKNKEQELNDLISGKSKFAELRLNWDDPKTYDLADKLKAQGFESTIADQGKDQITLFHKASEDIAPILNAKTPYDFGKAYGYSDNDVAAFYNNKYGKDAEKYWNQDSLK